ncbi:MAG: PilZ domain-containing protein [Candidatus Omnitrophota bacterium]|nr:PilZ domain-containing protein [Candidatus Omnitrophota bacterium]
MDKREFAREFSASVIKLFDQEGNLIYRGKISDISAGGVLVISHGVDEWEDFDQGEEMNFTLDIPTGKVSGVAEVVWTRPEDERMGLKFTRILNRQGASDLLTFLLG